MNQFCVLCETDCGEGQKEEEKRGFYRFRIEDYDSVERGYDDVRKRVPKSCISLIMDMTIMYERSNTCVRS